MNPVWGIFSSSQLKDSFIFKALHAITQTCWFNMHTVVVHAGTLQHVVIKDRKKTVLVVVLMC